MESECEGLFGRRDVLAFGTAALALTGAPGIARATDRRIVGHVIDSRFPLRAPPPAGGWRETIDGDVTALWYHRLDALWRDPATGPISGVTGADALFVLEHLAWDRQRRVVLREDVPASGPVPLVRWTIAPRARG